MNVDLHIGDLPANIDFGPSVAIDTETMGLNPLRDRLCLVQLSRGDGTAHLVRIPQKGQEGGQSTPNLARLLANPAVTKIFHFARFDLAALKQHTGVTTGPVYCTKIASRLARTYTDRHGLRDVCKDLLNVDLSKQQQSSDWGDPNLSEAQLKYAASDVLHLHALKAKLDEMLAREGRTELARACFDFLSTRSQLDLMGWSEMDIFSH